MNNIVEINKIANYFSIDLKILIKYLIDYSEKYNVKVINKNQNNVFVTLKSFYNELMRIETFLNSLIISKKDIINKKSNKVLIKRLPLIYFLLDNNNIVYIGQTRNILNRTSSHQQDKNFDFVSCFRINVIDISITEIMNIKFYKPKYNNEKFSNLFFFDKIMTYTNLSDIF